MYTLTTFFQLLKNPVFKTPLSTEVCPPLICHPQKVIIFRTNERTDGRTNGRTDTRNTLFWLPDRRKERFAQKKQCFVALARRRRKILVFLDHYPSISIAKTRFLCSFLAQNAKKFRPAAGWRKLLLKNPPPPPLLTIGDKQGGVFLCGGYS